MRISNEPQQTEVPHLSGNTRVNVWVALLRDGPGSSTGSTSPEIHQVQYWSANVAPRDPASRRSDYDVDRRRSRRTGQACDGDALRRPCGLPVASHGNAARRHGPARAYRRENRTDKLITYLGEKQNHRYVSILEHGKPYNVLVDHDDRIQRLAVLNAFPAVLVQGNWRSWPEDATPAEDAAVRGILPGIGPPNQQRYIGVQALLADLRQGCPTRNRSRRGRQ